MYHSTIPIFIFSGKFFCRKKCQNSTDFSKVHIRKNFCDCKEFYSTIHTVIQTSWTNDKWNVAIICNSFKNKAKDSVWNTALMYKVWFKTQNFCIITSSVTKYSTEYTIHAANQEVIWPYCRDNGNEREDYTELLIEVDDWNL